jgi:predicted small secreted protein
MIKKVLSALLALGMLVSVSACNTFAGAGKDIQRGGEAIEDTAKDTQKNM